MNLPIRFFLVLTMRSAVDKKKNMFEAKKEEGSSNNSECVCVFCPPSGQF